MSYDFATEKVCSHTIGPERVLLNSNDSTFFVFKSIPVNNKVTVRLDGTEIPQSGLYSKAKVVFSNQEPYRIVSGESDQLLISIGQESPRLVNLPPGHKVPASDIIRAMNVVAPELIYSVQNGRIVVETSTPVVGNAFVFVNPVWNDKTQSLPQTKRVLGALKRLGVNPGRVGTGRKLFPGWKVTLNPAAFFEEYILVFDEPIPNDSPVLTVIYQTIAPSCSRCFGSRLEYDYTVIGQSYEIVVDTDLLAQELDKFLFVKIGSHWKWRWLGSAVTERIGGKADSILGTASGFVSMDLTQAFSTYQNIKQQQDSNFPQQDVTDAEFPYTLDSLNVTSDPSDPTVVYANIVVRSRSRVQIPLTRNIQAPDPFQLSSDPIGMIKQFSFSSGFKPKG